MSFQKLKFAQLMENKKPEKKHKPWRGKNEWFNNMLRMKKKDKDRKVTV